MKVFGYICRHLQFLQSVHFPCKITPPRRLIMWCALMLLIGAGPATKSSTRPNEVDSAKSALTQREMDLADARGRVNQATADCLKKLRESETYKSKAAEVENLKLKLDAARLSGTAKEKIDASSAYGKAANALKQMEADALKTDADLKTASDTLVSDGIELEGARDDLTRAQAKAKEDEKRRIDADPILAGIRDHRLVLGMTLQQALEAADNVGEKKYESTTGFEYEFRISENSNADNHSYRHRYLATFENGKITSIDDRGLYQE